MALVATDTSHSPIIMLSVDELPALLGSCTQTILDTKKRFDLVDFSEASALFSKCSTSKGSFECQVLALEAAIKDTLRGVHCLQNELNPIHGLPPEILCSVFDFFCQQMKDYTWEAFCLSHVCQRWRNITLAYSPLWSHIIIHGGNLDYLEECLRRSNGSPLHVRLDIRGNGEEGPSAAVEKAIEVLEPHSERIVTMDIIVPPSFDYRLLSILTVPIPNLQRFRYSSNGNVNSDFVFPGDFPRLKTLELGHMMLWPINLLVNATSLTLSLPGRYREVHLPHLLTALSYSPKLQYLTIANCIIATQPGLNSFHPTVALPELEKLSLTSCHPVRILRFLHLPATLKTTIRFPVPWYRGLDIFATFPEDITRLEFLEKLTSLKLLSIDTFPTMIGHNPKGGSFSIEYPARNGFPSHEIYRSLALLPLHCVKQFTSNGIPWNMRLPQMLERMTSLEVLNISASESDIGPAFRDLLPRAGCTPLCPNLQQLNAVIRAASIELGPFHAMREMFKSRTGCVFRAMACVLDKERSVVFFGMPRNEGFPSPSAWESKFN